MHIIFSSSQKQDEISIYWDDENLIVEPYERKNKHYFCGRELLKFTTGKSLVYQIIVADYSEGAYAKIWSDGEIEIIWRDDADIPKKHRKGGQSAPRFGRMRDNAITVWFKKLNDVLKDVDGQIYVGMSDVYYKRFYNKLDTYNKEKIKERMSCEYSGITGVYQMVNKLELERNNKNK